MNNNYIELSVVIVTYNSSAFIYNCLQSIDSFNDIDSQLEVIIIDNTSQSEADHIAEQISIGYNFTSYVKYSGENIGFGAANNLGADLARGKYICFLNADTLLIEPIFRKAIDNFSNSKVRTVGPRLVNQFGNYELSFFFIRGYFASFSSFLVFKLNDYNIKFGNMITSGACMFVRKSDFILIGGFNPFMFLYHEESYLAMKYKRRFRNNIFRLDKTMRVVHLEKINSVSSFRVDEYFKSMAYYYNYFGFNKNIVLALAYTKYLILFFFKRSSREYRLNEYNFLKFNLMKKYE